MNIKLTSPEAYQLARLAIAGYNLQPIRLKKLKTSNNSVFHLDTASGKTYGLRLNRPGVRSRFEIENELAWLNALTEQTDLRVPQPQPTAKDQWFLELDRPGTNQQVYAVLFEWLPGRHCSQRLSVGIAQQLGRVMAELHNHAAGWQPPHFSANRKLDRAWFYDSPFLSGREFTELEAEWFPPTRRPIFEQATALVSQLLTELYSQPSQVRLLHADLHPGNLKINQKKFYLLDFDDCLQGLPIQDIATTFYYLQFYPNYQALRTAFERGYCEFASWPQQVPGQLEILIIARELNLLSFVMNSDDPSYPPRMAGWVERAETRLHNWMGRL